MTSTRLNKRNDEPMRTCIGCRERAPQGALLRVARLDDGVIVPNLSSHSMGRSSWVHGNAECIRRGLRGAFQKSFKGQGTLKALPFLEQLQAQAERRIGGLLSASRASGNSVFGGDSVADAYAAASLVILAVDAAATSQLPVVSTALQEGKLIVWGTKREIGIAVGRPETAIASVQNAHIASAIQAAVALREIAKVLVVEFERTREGSSEDE